ncbi:MAG: hypothetical protein ABFD82_04540 [Syntrophaceae bacterium]
MALDRLKGFILCGDSVPFEVYKLRAVPDDTGGYPWRVDELDVDAPVENSMAVRFIPLADADWTNLTGLLDPVRQTLLLTTDTPGDVEAMERVLAEGELAGSWPLPIAALESSVYIYNSYR